VASTVTWTCWLPPGGRVPLVGLSDSHGTSVNDGTPLSIR
jgi:hypothetical protein